MGPKHAARIWSFMSKFIMLDRFAKTLGVATVYQGVLVPKKTCSVEYIGTGSTVSIFFQNARFFFLCLLEFQILNDLNPPTKLLKNFLKTWGEREKTWAQYSHSSSISLSDHGLDPASVALNLSKRLLNVGKVKKIVRIEAGLEMIAFGVAISSAVHNIDFFESHLILFLSIRTMGFSRKRLGTLKTS